MHISFKHYNLRIIIMGFWCFLPVELFNGNLHDIYFLLSLLIVISHFFLHFFQSNDNFTEFFSRKWLSIVFFWLNFDVNNINVRYWTMFEPILYLFLHIFFFQKCQVFNTSSDATTLGSCLRAIGNWLNHKTLTNFRPMKASVTNIAVS